MTRILITGGSGYIGSHTVDNFLRHGYTVCLVGRNEDSCKRMKALHEGYGDRIDTIVVPDITSPGAFNHAVQGVAGVIHMASPFKYKIEDNERDLLIPAIQGTTQILKSVLDHAPSVNRVVLTSSFAAVNDFSQGLRPGHVYDESQWNPLTYDQARDGSGGLAYGGSKALAERAAWDLVNNAGSRKLSLATINPVMVYGPPLPGTASIKHLGQSASEIYALFDGSLDTPPPTPMPVFVDVRDVAEAHRLAFEAKEGGRFLLCAGSYSNQGVCQLLRSELPSLAGRVPPPQGTEDPSHYTVDSSRAKEVLGLKFRGFEQTFLEMAQALLALEQEQRT